MIDKNSTNELNNEETKKIVDGTSNKAVSRRENDCACGSFICKMCGGTANQHTVKANDYGSTSIYTNVRGFWSEEWTHYELDCNHCKFFNHTYGAMGECKKDAN